MGEAMDDTAFFFAALAAYQQRTGDQRGIIEILNDTALFRQILREAQHLKVSVSTMQST